jgi:hypothetical protein
MDLVSRYVHLDVNGLSGVIKATPHHTFPTCALNGVEVMAKDLAEGSCVVTASGKKLVKSVRRVMAEDKTFTLEMEEGIKAVSVGGVFTHAFTHAKSMTPAALAETGHHNATAVKWSKAN